MDGSKEKFNLIVSENLTRKSYSQEDIEKIKKFLLSTDTEKKDPTDYFKRKNFKVVEFKDPVSAEVTFLLHSMDNRLVAATEDLYDIISAAHISTGHGGRDVMEKKLHLKFFNVTRQCIKTFINLCEECQLKRTRVSKSVVVKPIISSEFNSRCQIDLIDMQADSDGPYKWILNYQDHLSKFVLLRPLKSKTAVEVAYHLIDIFGILGAPYILQSDNGREFANQVVKEVAAMWPQCHIVHGKPRHSQSQGSVERANKDVQDKLTCWRSQNKGQRWSEGLRFVQFQKNSCHHMGIQTSPYEALFGVPPRNGIKDMTGFPAIVLDKLETEEDLEIMLGSTTTEGTLTDSENPILCVACDLPTDSFCKKCDVAIHYAPTCGDALPHSSSDVSFDYQCKICSRKDSTSKVREKARTSLQKQADAMTLRSRQRYDPAAIGNTVMIPRF